MSIPNDILRVLANLLSWQEFLPKKLYLVHPIWNAVFRAKFLAFRPDRCRLFYGMNVNKLPKWVPVDSLLIMNWHPIHMSLYVKCEDIIRKFEFKEQIPRISDSHGYAKYAHELPSVRYFAGARSDGSEQFPTGFIHMLTGICTESAIIKINVAQISKSVQGIEWGILYIRTYRYPNGRTIYLLTQSLLEWSKQHVVKWPTVFPICLVPIRESTHPNITPDNTLITDAVNPKWMYMSHYAM